MANQKRGKEIRETVVNNVADVLSFENFEFVGISSEGAVFNNGEDTFVVRVIVKAETFDFNDAIAEYDEKQKKAEDKKNKHDKKVEKELDKKAKAKAEEEKKE